LQVVDPFFAQTQARQRCATQVIKSAATCAATVTLQVVGVAVPVPVRAMTAWTTAIGAPGMLDEGDDLCQPCGWA